MIGSVNVMLAPAAGLLLMLIDRRGQRGFEKTSWRLIMYTIIATLAAMFSEICYDAAVGNPGGLSRVVCWTANTLYFIFQTAAFGLLVAFLDYCANEDLARLKKIGAVIGGIFAVNVAIQIVNLFTGVIFTITPDNLYARGDWYFLRLFVTYSLVLICFIDTLSIRKNLNKTMFHLVLVAVIPACVGSTADLIVGGSRLIWPCFFVSLLFSYLVIIRMNARTDSLTGVNNRRGFDEYLLLLSKNARSHDYTFIMADLDEFKAINDVHGHAQGDGALRDAAYVMRSAIRRTDFLARYGGDEFVILAPTNETNAIIENVQCRLTLFNEKKSRPYVLKLSIGGDVYRRDDARTPQEFMTYVDGLMYAKKAANKRRPDG